MRRNRKNSIKKERIIMIASSAFVLAALTLTGVYMKEGNVESKDGGYTVDFSAVEKKDEEKQGTPQNNSNPSRNTTELNQANNNNYSAQVTEDDLDYMPMEAGSNLVEIPGLTGESLNAAEENLMAEGIAGEAALTEDGAENGESEAEKPEGEAAEADPGKASNDGKKQEVIKELSFQEGSSLTIPVSGEVLLPYSMGASIYFATLDQYKYNPAVIFSAEEGTSVVACAEGKVVNIFEDAEIGHAVTLELGNGYQATYGQLTGIEVTLDSYVNPGDTLAAVAAPTKYFSAEGSNLYFKLTKDGAPVNPEEMF